MKTSIDPIGTNKVKLSVEVPAPDVARYVQDTYRKLAGEIRVPGFRPGRVPRQIIDQRLGKDFVRSEALKEALPELLEKAVESSELDVVAPPEIDVKTYEDGQDLIFEAVLEVRPTPDLKDYTGLEVERPATGVTDDEVSDQIERLRVRYATLEDIERPLQPGDFALIDLSTYHHDQVIEDISAKDLLIEIGAELVVAELDAELVGKRKGDILKVSTALPERYGERAGLQVGMQILVKETKARRLPELDDELAKTVSEFDTLDELRDELRERLSAVKTVQADAAVRERVLDAFVESGVAVELPEGMVQMEIDRLTRSFLRMLQAQDANFDQYLQAENIDYEAFRERLRPQAERNLTLTLGLDAVARAEGLEVAEEDRRTEVARLAEQLGRPVDEIADTIAQSGDGAEMDRDILRSKALDLLVARAGITEEGSA